MPRLEVRSRIVGSPDMQDPPSSVVIELLNEQLTVRELITHTVQEQVREMLIQRKLDVEKAQSILRRQYMTNTEIREQAKSGAVKQPSIPDVQIDTPTEIQRALTAFEQGIYLIVVDGEQVESLRETIALTEHSKVNFVRLTPLVGG